MNRETLKGVMIGAGYFAGFQAEAWRRIAGVEIAAACDVDAEKADAFARHWEIPHVYKNAAEMLERERPDFVDIVTRPQSHLELTRLAAERGVHVICQKPMAPTWDESVEMVNVCAAHGVRLMIHENWRWQPCFREIKRLLDTGLFGAPVYAGFVMRSGDGWGDEPYSVQPYFREMERLLIYEMAVHFLDTLRFTAGEIRSVYCQLRRQNPAIRGEDCALVQLAFESGAFGLIDANRFTGLPKPTPTFGDFTLEGERARVRATPAGDIFIAEYGQPEVAHEYVNTTQGYKGDSVWSTQRHFIECLRSGVIAESEGSEYLKTVAAVFACYASAESGQVVFLKH